MQIDYKMKYKELKLKFKETVDLAFRLGIQEGMRQGELQQAQQAQADAQAMQQAAIGGQPGEEGAPGQDMPGQGPSDGSELDQHIGTLESMLQKTDPTSAEAMSLKKSLEGIKSFKMGLKKASDLRKSEAALAAISKAMKGGFTLSQSATKNMSPQAQKSLNSQEKVLEDVMKSFAEEEQKATEAIKKTLSLEQVLKG